MLGKLNETKQMAEELASRQRPGTLCFQSCPVDDERCEGYLAKQQEKYKIVSCQLKDN